jgi:CheY-like chemotaxis protein
MAVTARSFQIGGMAEVTRGRVVVIEDRADMRSMLFEILHGEGFSVDTFDSGARALEFLETGVVPGLILLDLMLRPDMNGWQFLEELRRIPRLGEVPVVAMTAAPLDHAARAECKAQSILEKPFEYDALEEILETYFGPRAESDVIVAPPDRRHPGSDSAGHP